MNKLGLITKQGREQLGRVLLDARRAKGLTTRAVVQKLEERTGQTLSNAVITDLENANREPQWNTLAKLAAIGYVTHPRTGEPFSTSDLFLIACEALDPYAQPAPPQVQPQAQPQAERMTTEAGRRNLGLLLKSARLSLGWSIRDLARELEERTGLSLSPPTIGDLEKGTWEPQWNTLVKLVALGYIRHPEIARRMTVYELFLVACEAFEPSARQSFEISDGSALTLSNSYIFACLETAGGV